MFTFFKNILNSAFCQYIYEFLRKNIVFYLNCTISSLLYIHFAEAKSDSTHTFLHIVSFYSTGTLCDFHNIFSLTWICLIEKRNGAQKRNPPFIRGFLLVVSAHPQTTYRRFICLPFHFSRRNLKCPCLCPAVFAKSANRNLCSALLHIVAIFYDFVLIAL